MNEEIENLKIKVQELEEKTSYLYGIIFGLKAQIQDITLKKDSYSE